MLKFVKENMPDEMPSMQNGYILCLKVEEKQASVITVSSAAAEEYLVLAVPSHIRDYGSGGAFSVCCEPGDVVRLRATLMDVYLPAAAGGRRFFKLATEGDVIMVRSKNLDVADFLYDLS